MRRYTLLLCVWAEIEDELDCYHGFWGFASDLLFVKAAEINK